MHRYHNILKHILIHGSHRPDRTGTGTLSVFGYQTRYPIATSFPLLTTKKIHVKSIVHELLWYLRGDTNIKYLNDNGVRIWDEWAVQNKEISVYPSRDFDDLVSEYAKVTNTPYDDAFLDLARLYDTKGYKEFSRYLAQHRVFVKDRVRFPDLGDLGPIYGRQWRSWPRPNNTHVDQIKHTIKNLIKDPFSRRHIINVWNVGEIDEMKLSPCVCMLQFYVDDICDEELSVFMQQNPNRRLPLRRLSCHIYQRSADAFLGIPFNIATYALFTHMVAHVCNYMPGDLIHSFGDLHLYEDHVEKAYTQLDRAVRPAPTLTLNPDVMRIDDFTYDDIHLSGYDPHPVIKAQVSV